jgi:hypothetical protein
MKDMGWTEKARAAALAARRVLGKAKQKFSAFLGTDPETVAKWKASQQRWHERLKSDFEEAIKREAADRLKGETKISYRRGDKPYKVTQYNPKTKEHRIIASRWSFGEAYSYPGGTHVVQTHGTEAELRQQATGEHVEPSVGAEMARRAVGGALIAGPIGAAAGAMTSSGSRYGKWYELPHPNIIPKRFSL